MERTVLLVDDEENILNSFRRTLRRRVDIELASSGQQALELIAEKHYAVVVSDMQMPGINGLQLLQQVKKRSPDTVRIMLTGNADQQTAIDAVNLGDVFRFVTKPCSSEQMLSFIEAAIAQYELVVAERVLLNNTLKGVINVLSDVVSLVSPEINDRSNRVYFHMDRLAEAIQLKPNWSFNPMVRLSQLGHILFPQSTLEHLSQGKVVSDEDRRLFSQHPRLAYDMLRQIPKMGGIAKTILYQDKGFNGEGIPNDDVKGLDLPLGSRMLKVVCDYVTFESSGASVADSLSKIEANSHLYDPNILLAFKKTLTYESTITLVDVRNINNGMVLSQDLLTSRGQLIASSGQRITPTLLNIITHCLKNNAIKGEVLVSTIAK